MSSELCPCCVGRESEVRASAGEQQRGHSSPLSDYTLVLMFPTSQPSHLPDLQKTSHSSKPGSLSTLSMKASHTELTPDRDLVSLRISLSITNFLEQESLPDASADEEIQPRGQNIHPKGHKAGASHSGVKPMRLEDG